MLLDDFARERFKDEREEYSAEEQRRRRIRSMACRDGFCGAMDCPTCRGESAYAYDESEEEEEEQESRRTQRVVTARKARFIGLPQEIRAGDKVSVTSWFSHKDGGARTGYHHWYHRLEKGPAWSE